MKKLIGILITVAVSAVFVFGQTSSGVTGTVSDASGAVIPGVNVKLVDTKTSREVSTVTNNEGAYSFNNLAPGAGYELTFSAQGFQTFVLKNVQIGTATTATQNAQLTAGQVTETVEVTSTSGDATLNTTDSSIGNIIGSRELKELPIQIRGTPAALIGLQPGAVGNNVFAGGGNRTGSVTGSRVDQGNITIDGIDANDQATGQASALWATHRSIRSRNFAQLPQARTHLQEEAAAARSSLRPTAVRTPITARSVSITATRRLRLTAFSITGTV